METQNRERPNFRELCDDFIDAVIQSQLFGKAHMMMARSEEDAKGAMAWNIQNHAFTGHLYQPEACVRQVKARIQDFDPYGVLFIFPLLEQRSIGCNCITPNRQQMKLLQFVKGQEFGQVETLDSGWKNMSMPIFDDLLNVLPITLKEEDYDLKRLATFF